ncbi:hypothetical protein E1262_09030 [Jiangella aurantiaca]|uniref:Uncharacterized protein n=1 Tax=Jiangella aurantiaca TaxID=2530373 RepID=A0A4R5AHA3_9ACTN|nr:hypothetical protein [Jiangella aurantiaca]TDD70776.1 hypothetical protein E1262_09030 [Jiangella aurantiaca]
MATTPAADRRDVIARSAFLSDDVGEIIAWHDTEGPAIDIRLAPAESGQRADVSVTPSEVRTLARQLTEIADTAQRAGWTPAVLADARERYLPGLSDEQIIARLDALTARLGGLVLGFRGKVDWRAGRILVAETGNELLGRAATAVDAAEQYLAGYQQAVDQLTTVKAELDHVRRFFEHESELDR